MRVEDVHSKDDVRELDPIDLAQLAATPVTQLDLLLLKLEIGDSLRALQEAFSERLEEVARAR